MDLQALVEAGKTTEAERDRLMSNVGAGLEAGMRALLTPAQLQEFQGDRLMPQVAAVLSPQQYADFDQMRQSAVAAAGIARLTNQLSATLGAH